MTELADIFRAAGPAYLQRFGDRLLLSHLRVLRDVVACRTPALGGEMYLCQKCGHQHSVYHSCRNRHCPKCQGDQTQRWLDRQRDLLLPSQYGLATCTLPAGLRSVARSHQRVVYSILMREAAHALLEMAANPHFIGGLTAIMAVLHTWTRALILHPHVHMLFPIGGLSNDGAWVKPKNRRFALPGFGLAKLFRKRVELAFRNTGLYDLVPQQVWRQRWVANVKPVGTGQTALLYLARYVFRVAITNHRILDFDGRSVTFSAKNRHGTHQRITLSAHDFISRFLQHVLPRHFVKVRYYGLWASACRAKLETARRILEDHHAAIGRKPRRTATHQPTPPPAPRCPKCGCLYDRPPVTIPRSREPP